MDVIVQRTDGERITDEERREVVIIADHDDISMTWSRYAPGERGPDAHVHREHTDAFYVLDGELTLELGPDGGPHPLAAGGFAAVPPNVVHSFVSSGGGDARFLNFHSPDKGFAQFLRDRRDGRDAAFDSFDPPEDGGLQAAEVILAGPGEGEDLGRVLLKGAVEDICLAEWEIDSPFEGPPLHDHDDQVDSFYVISGELEITLEDGPRAIGPDTLASAPRGLLHTFAHRRDAPARFLNIHTPDAGFADFLRSR